MELGWDARYLRCLAFRACARFRSGTARSEHLLLALMEQRHERVRKCLDVLGVDVEAIEAEASRWMSNLVFDEATYYEEWLKFLSFFDVAPEVAAQLGSARVGSEHLLVALVEASKGRVARLLRKHGLKPEVLRQALRDAPTGDSTEDDGAWRDRLIRDAWHHLTSATEEPSSIPRTPRDYRGKPLPAWRIERLLGELREAREYYVLGHFYQAMGAADRLLQEAGGLGRRTQTFPAQQYVMAAHFFRLAGNPAESELAARTAICLLETTEPMTWPNGTPYEMPYLVELRGDAAVCFDRELARGCYADAIAGFVQLDEGEQMGEDAEDFGWGGFHRSQAESFLPDVRRTRNLGEGRVTLKLQYWLGT